MPVVSDRRSRDSRSSARTCGYVRPDESRANKTRLRRQSHESARPNAVLHRYREAFSPTMRPNSRSNVAPNARSPTRRQTITLSRAASSSRSASGPLSSSARRKLRGSNTPAATKSSRVKRLRAIPTRLEPSPAIVLRARKRDFRPPETGAGSGDGLAKRLGPIPFEPVVLRRQREPAPPSRSLRVPCQSCRRFG